jgi:hypothetical protein
LQDHLLRLHPAVAVAVDPEEQGLVGRGCPFGFIPAGQRLLKASSWSRFQSLARPKAATGTAMPSRSRNTKAMGAPLVGLLFQQLVK